MAYPYPDLEPGSWEASWDAQAPTCPTCGLILKGRLCTCEAPAVERERIVRDWLPAAVVFPVPSKTQPLSQPETIWFDSTWMHTRLLAVQHAQKLARATRGVCKVL